MLFNNVDISCKRLPEEDHLIYKKRRAVINRFLKLYLKHGNDRTQIFKKGYKQKVKSLTEKSLIKEIAKCQK